MTGGIDTDLAITCLDIRTGTVATGTAHPVVAIADHYPQAPRWPIETGEQTFNLRHPFWRSLDYQPAAHSGNRAITADKGLYKRQDLFVGTGFQLDHLDGIVCKRGTGNAGQRGKQQ
jgi:hypothetical protein